MVYRQRLVCKLLPLLPRNPLPARAAHLFLLWDPFLIIGNEQVLLLPTIFNKLNEKTLYIFGAVNVISIVVVWALYPESNQRTLEEMDLVFAGDSIWN